MLFDCKCYVPAAIATLGIASSLVGFAQSPSAPERTVEKRRWQALAIDTVWTLTSDPHRERGLVYPIALAVLPTSVVILDASRRRVIAVSRDNGAVVWTAGPNGRGDESFDTPRTFAVLPSGDVLVSDAKQGALVRLSAAGKFKARWQADAFKTTESACAIDDSTLLAATSGGSGGLVRISLSSHRVSEVPFPWPELAGSHELLKQGVFSSARGSPCTFLLTVGRGMAVFDRRLSRLLVDFVEQIPAPALRTTKRRGSFRGASADVEEVRLVQPQITTMSATGDKACLWALFVGNTSDAGRILDEYDIRKGAYVTSYRFALPLKYVVKDGADWFVIGKRDGFPYLQRLHVGLPRATCGTTESPSGKPSRHGDR